MPSIAPWLSIEQPSSYFTALDKLTQALQEHLEILREESSNLATQLEAGSWIQAEPLIDEHLGALVAANENLSAFLERYIDRHPQAHLVQFIAEKVTEYAICTAESILEIALRAIALKPTSTLAL